MSKVEAIFAQMASGEFVNQAELAEVFRIKYGNPRSTGWGPRMRFRFNYFTPDDYYEAAIAKLVARDCSWLDVGCGRHVFPSNARLARTLADRCSLLVGVDPDETVNENAFVHQRVNSYVEDYRSDHAFDLVTLRMCAEHVAEPDRTVAAFSRLTKPGGKVIIYTINRWSPVPIMTWLVPFGLHQPIKRVLWKTEEQDTFPVSYLMNTRKDLSRVFRRNGFREFHFAYLDDCRTTSRFWLGQLFELSSWKLLKILGLKYPENCLLGIYERL
jgi:2-polyprenyl-3-methyl-5-hydroxy-6-metoxy-1,4-benzoquinol methylase